LGTNVENVKNDMTYQEKLKKLLENEKELMEKEKENLNRKIHTKDDDLKDKANEIEELKQTLRKKDLDFIKS
jgi:hypothetical protein